MFEFFILSLVSGVFEVGSILYVLNDTGSIVLGLMTALAYHLGNLVPCPIQIRQNVLKVISLLSIIGWIAALFSPHYIVIFITTALSSAATQQLRSTAKSSASKHIKRLFRVSGFFIAVIFNPYTAIVFSVALFIFSLKYKDAYAQFENKVMIPKMKFMNNLMIIHQIHYFIYCYSILILAHNTYGTVIAAAIFLAGWITYISMEPLCGDSKKYYVIFLLGHISLVLLLAGINISDSPIVQAILWILTGFGGASSFCIIKFTKDVGQFDLYTNTFSENIGHVLGVLFGVIAYIITKDLFTSTLISLGCNVIIIIIITINYSQSFHKKTEMIGN